MFKKIPKWIKDFPYELDRAALTNLAKQSKDIEAPREMIFYIYDIASEDAAINLAERAKGNGWEVSIRKDPSHAQYLVAEAKKDNYLLSERGYIEDSAFFQRLAREYKAHYDGWVASS